MKKSIKALGLAMTLLFSANSMALTKEEANLVLPHRVGLMIEMMGDRIGEIEARDKKTGISKDMTFSDYQRYVFQVRNKVTPGQKPKLSHKIARNGLITLSVILGTAATFTGPGMIAAAFMLPAMGTLGVAGILARPLSLDQKGRLALSYGEELKKKLFKQNLHSSDAFAACSSIGFEKDMTCLLSQVLTHEAMDELMDGDLGDEFRNAVDNVERALKKSSVSPAQLVNALTK